MTVENRPYGSKDRSRETGEEAVKIIQTRSDGLVQVGSGGGDDER